jgi:hypothetical protein
MRSAAVLLALLLASPARADELPIDLDAYFWVDSGYLNRTNAQAGQYDQIANYMQGRLVLGASYTGRIDDWYATAKLELMGLVNELAKFQYEPHTLDAYLRAGHRRWDVTVGRFLAWEVYYRGQGIELYTAEEAGALGAPPLYLLDFARGHKNEAGQAALHVHPFDWLGIEVAGVYGQEANQNCVGVRPVLDLRFAGAQLVGGYELFKQIPQTVADKVEVTSQGLAARLQYTLAFATFGVDASRATIDAVDIQGLEDTEKTLTRTSLGGFVDLDFWRNSIGLGYHHTRQENQQMEESTHDQTFVSYLFRLPIKGLAVKAVYGFARGHIEDIDTQSEWQNDMHSFRVRAIFDLR